MRTQSRNRWTLTIVSVALFIVVLDNLVVSIALPSIWRDLGSSIQSLEWTVNAYVLPYAVLLLTGAALGDRFGRRRMFIAGLTLFTLAWLAATLSTQMPYSGMLVPFLMAGAGIALVFAPSANAVLAAVRDDQAGQASGATNAIREVGGVLGVAVLASIFTAHGGYATPAAFVAGLGPAL